MPARSRAEMVVVMSFMESAGGDAVAPAVVDALILCIEAPEG